MNWSVALANPELFKPSMLLGNDNKSPTRFRLPKTRAVHNERRLSHTWVIGKSGVGKSTSLLRWASGDIEKGSGVAFFDTDGKIAEKLLTLIPKSRFDDVIWFDPSDFPISINPFDTVPQERKGYVAASLVDTFKSVWGYTGFATPTLDMFLYNSARAMLDHPDGTLFAMKFLITNQKYRKRVLSYLSDEIIREFWKVDFNAMPEREQREKTLSTLNKLNAMNADPYLRPLIASPETKLDFSDIITSRKILIISAPQSKLGLEKSSLIGSILLNQLLLGIADSTCRVNSKNYHIYIDNCDRFAHDPILELLLSASRSGVSLTLANRYLGQLNPKLKSALIGSIGTIVSFQLGATDADTLEPEFKLYADDYSLCELNPFMAYIRSGLSTKLLDIPNLSHQGQPGNVAKIKNLSRNKYAINTRKLERDLHKFMRGCSQSR